MGKLVHVTADRVRNGMRRLKKLTEKDEAWQAELKELVELDIRHREQWDAEQRVSNGDPGKGV